MLWHLWRDGIDWCGEWLYTLEYQLAQIWGNVSVDVRIDMLKRTIVRTYLHTNIMFSADVYLLRNRSIYAEYKFHKYREISNLRTLLWQLLPSVQIYYKNVSTGIFDDFRQCLLSVCLSSGNVSEVFMSASAISCLQTGSSCSSCEFCHTRHGLLSLIISIRVLSQ